MLIANMAMSDLLYPIFMFPVPLADLHVGSWLIGGTLGQALCKIYPFLADISTLVSIQSLVLITVDRYAAVVVPLRSPLISRKVCRCLIVGTWILAVLFCWLYLFNFNLVEYQGELKVVHESVGCDLRREKLIWYLPPISFYLVLLHPFRRLGDTLLHHPDQA